VTRTEQPFVEHLFSTVPNARSDVKVREVERVFACGRRPW
jgi:hypothetical protein